MDVQVDPNLIRSEREKRAWSQEHLAAAAGIGARTIQRIEGLRGWLQQCGKWVVEDTLLRPGTPRRDWRQTQVSDGYVVVRHPEWDEALRMCQAAVTGIKMYAQ